MSDNSISLNKVAMLERIDSIKVLYRVLEEIDKNIKSLPFDVGKQSQGPNAANMQEFQILLSKVVVCGKEVVQAAMDYLLKSYIAFNVADSQ